MIGPTALRRVFDALLAHRRLTILALLAFTLPLCVFASRVRPSFKVENYFPSASPVKHDYDRFKARFPHEDALAVVILEAADLWTPAGVTRVGALEKDLVAIDGVVEVQGLTRVRDIAGREGEVRLERLFPDGLDESEILRRRDQASGDPLLAWSLVTPPPPRGPAPRHKGRGAGATTIAVTLQSAYAADETTRTRFLLAARAVLQEHAARAERAGVRQTLTLTGVPVIRSEYNELIAGDVGKLFPIALLLIFAVLYAGFRSWKVLFAALTVIVLSVIWTYGVMGILGYSIEILTTVTPMIVMTISLSDTLHIVAHYRSALADGAEPRAAIAEAATDTAIPCLLTELTVAAGFLTLLGVGVTALSEFGVATAAGMILTWLANMLVLPVALDLLRPASAGTGKPALAGVLDGITTWIEGAVRRRPRRVLALTVVIVAIAGAFASRVERRHRSFGDLPDDHPLMQNVAVAERIHGGVVPLMVFIEPPASASEPEAVPGPPPVGVAAAAQPPREPTGGEMLEPAAIALMDRVARWLERRVPEVTSASSAADLWRKTFTIFAPEMAARSDGLPATRPAAAQLHIVFDDPAITRHYLAADLGSAAVLTVMPNVDSRRGSEILTDLGRYLETERAATGYRISVTGLFANLADINQVLLDGLTTSLGWALLVSFGVFTLVLRSPRLALLAMIPNVLPLAITFGFMGMAGLHITASTVVVCAITLTVADDDTIQFFSRFRMIYARRRAEGHPQPQRAAALETMRALGTPMILTATVITIGFLALAFSTFNGLVQLGVITGVSLFAAMFADLFLSPLLASALTPELRFRGPREPAEEDAP